MAVITGIPFPGALLPCVPQAPVQLVYWRPVFRERPGPVRSLLRQRPRRPRPGPGPGPSPRLRPAQSHGSPARPTPPRRRPGQRRILIDPVRWRGTPSPDHPAPDLAPFQQAALTDRRLRLRYRHGRDNRVGTYTVDPYGLVNKAGVWYLVADHDGEARLFRTDRALSASVLDQPARLRDGQELTDVWQTLRRRIDDIPAPLAVTARVRNEILAKFLRIHEADLAAPAPAESPPEPEGEPGWTKVELRFRSLVAAEALLAFGPDAEVLTPEDLRQALARKVAATAALYTPCQDT
ncbi:helix-turn-helix transcriptional regulator [Streptomyces sp. NPDC002888]|uniref:helix-turn-helix transcriptional regulator n=1 Tax=Streptomyces sp. NPDC002888 TaxID=3364668 RepID=UPI0036C77A19